MFFVVETRFSDSQDSEWSQNLPVPCSHDLETSYEICTMDGGPGWKPRLRLVHEFSLLPHLDPFPVHGDDGSSGNCDGDGDEVDSNRFWRGQTLACSSVSDMQDKLFRLTGFGPYPYPRRAGVLLYMSPSETNDDDPAQYRLGCVVSHMYGVHGCRYVFGFLCAVGCTQNDLYVNGCEGTTGTPCFQRRVEMPRQTMGTATQRATKINRRLDPPPATLITRTPLLTRT